MSDGATLRIAHRRRLQEDRPVLASTRLSLRTCRTIRRRPAPRAERMANSRERAAARASKRLATFAQHMSRTRPTTPRSRTAVSLSSPPMTRSRKGSAVATCPLFVPGVSRASESATAEISTRAASRATPGFSRPMTLQIVWITLERDRDPAVDSAVSTSWWGPCSSCREDRTESLRARCR